MAYRPPTIEIYQILKSMTGELPATLMPFCIIGPAYKVKDTNVEDEQYAEEYTGSKKTVIFNKVDSTNKLLKRDPVFVNLLVYALDATESPLSDIEIVQSSANSVLGNTTVSANTTAGSTQLVHGSTDNGYPFSNYTGNFDIVVTSGGTDYRLHVDSYDSGTSTFTLDSGTPVDFSANDPIKVIGKEIYYNKSTKTIGNLPSTVMDVVTEGQYVFKKSYGSTSFDGSQKAYVTSVNTYTNSITIDIDLDFQASDIGPNTFDASATNDRLNLFSDVVTIGGYVPSESPYDEPYVPEELIADFEGKILDDGIILNAGMVDKYGNPITHAIIHSNYTVYSRTAIKSSATVNILQRIARVDDIERLYGDIRPENDLAYAIFLALASGKSGYAIATKSNEVSSYNKAFEKIKENDEVYAIVPLSQSDDVISSLKAHITYMSDGKQSAWRLGIVSGEQMPYEVTIAANVLGTTVYQNGVLNKFVFTTPITTSINPGEILRVSDVDNPDIDGDYTIVGVDTDSSGNVVSVLTETSFYPIAKSYNVTSITATDTIVFAEDVDFKAGDKIYLNETSSNDGWWTVVSVSGATVTVDDSVTSLVNESGNGTGTKEQFISSSIIYYNSQYAIAVNSKNWAASISERRIWNVFPDRAQISSPDILPGYFTAAAYAGFVCANPGPEPYTESTVPLITKVFGSNDVLGYDYLNIIAEGGNMILYHNGVGSLPTVRDQLTTNMDSLLSKYQSITINLDFISKTLKQMLDPLKAKHNIGESLLNAVHTTTVITLEHFKTSSAAQRLLSYTDPEIYTEGSCVIVKSELTVPIPGGTIKVYLNVRS